MGRDLSSTRRGFLQSGAARVAIASMPAPLCRNPPLPPLEDYSPEYFTAADGPLSWAATARLIPSDGEGPGAYETRVPVFIDLQLAGGFGQAADWYMEGPHDPASSANLGYQTPLTPAEIYRDAIARFDDWCVETEGAPFAELATDARMRRCRCSRKKAAAGARLRLPRPAAKAAVKARARTVKAAAKAARADRADRATTRRRVRASCATKAPSFFALLLQNTKEGYFSAIRATAAITAWRPGSISAFPAPAPISSNGSDRDDIPYPLGPGFNCWRKGLIMARTDLPQGCRHRRSAGPARSWAWRCCEEGLEVLALERGPDRDTVPDFQYPKVADELRYGVRFEFMATAPAVDHDDSPHHRRRGAAVPPLGLRSCWATASAAPVSTGTACTGARWWRSCACAGYVEENFGADIIPEGMQLQDWGVSYEELEPYFDRFEQVAGIAGQAGQPQRRRSSRAATRSRGRGRTIFPMPPLPTTLSKTDMFAEAAMQPRAPDLRAGRAAMPSQAYVNPYGMQLGPCNFCGYCERYGCLNYSKSSPQTCILDAHQAQADFQYAPMPRYCGWNWPRTARPPPA